jgi:hypothetical protein
MGSVPNVAANPDEQIADYVVRYRRHSIYDLNLHRSPKAIQTLERAGFLWLGTRALYHPHHWTIVSPSLGDMRFSTPAGDIALMAVSVEAKLAAANGAAIR